MSKTSIYNMVIGAVLMVFVAYFAASLISGMVTQYNIPIDADTPSLDGYENLTGYFGDYADDAEDAGENIKTTSSDDESILGTFRTIKKLLTIRSTVKDIQKENKSILSFIPPTVWKMIGIIIAITFVVLGAIAFWRYKEGIA